MLACKRVLLVHGIVQVICRYVSHEPSIYSTGNSAKTETAIKCFSC